MRQAELDFGRETRVSEAHRAVLRAVGDAVDALGLRMLEDRISWRATEYGGQPGRFPKHGLARIQWHGPWMRAGVPIRARYRKTHWVATIDAPHGRGVFDVNAVGSADGRCDGWTTEQAWASILVPHLTYGIPGADGAWSVTHAIEIARRS